MSDYWSVYENAKKFGEEQGAAAERARIAPLYRLFYACLDAEANGIPIPESIMEEMTNARGLEQEAIDLFIQEEYARADRARPETREGE